MKYVMTDLRQKDGGLITYRYLIIGFWTGIRAKQEENIDNFSAKKGFPLIIWN